MEAFRYHHSHFRQVNQLFSKLLGTSIQETFSSYFAKKKFKTRTFLLNLTSFWILQIMRYLGSLRISLRHSQRNFTQNEEEMFSFQDLNSNYKRILQYLVSMRIFAFSVIICYSCWEHFYSCSLPSVSKSKVKRREKNNYFKFINTVRSIFKGYTITISIKYILILEKAFTNQREVINISL